MFDKSPQHNVLSGFDCNTPRPLNQAKLINLFLPEHNKCKVNILKAYSFGNFLHYYSYVRFFFHFQCQISSKSKCRALKEKHNEKEHFKESPIALFHSPITFVNDSQPSLYTALYACLITAPYCKFYSDT